MQDNERYKSKYDESNELIKNLNKTINTQQNENFNYKNQLFEYEKQNLYNSLKSKTPKNNSNNSTIELKKEIQNLYKENNSLKNEINYMKLNMMEMTHQPGKESNYENFAKNKSDKNINMMKKELEMQKKKFIFK